jgi:hypothetical protein
MYIFAEESREIRTRSEKPGKGSLEKVGSHSSLFLNVSPSKRSITNVMQLAFILPDIL